MRASEYIPYGSFRHGGTTDTNDLIGSIMNVIHVLFETLLSFVRSVTLVTEELGIIDTFNFPRQVYCVNVFLILL